VRTCSVAAACTIGVTLLLAVVLAVVGYALVCAATSAPAATA